MRTLELLGGTHIRNAVAEALALAIDSREIVTFEFNGSTHEVHPDDTLDKAKARAEEVLGHPILTPEQESERVRLEMEHTKKEQADAIAAAGAATEAELRAANVPTLQTMDSLTSYISGLVDRPHDYGTCVYAMSMSAVAAFNYVADKLGVTGFQASCADLDILSRIRHLKHGFRIVDYGNLLYPQYWDEETRGIYLAALREQPARFAKEAADKLSEGRGADAILDHWRWIISQASELEAIEESAR